MWLRQLGPAVLAAKDFERLNTVLRHHNGISDSALGEGTLEALDVDLVVLDQQQIDGTGHDAPSLGSFGQTKWTSSPRPARSCRATLPPWASTNFLTIARPIPLPS